MALNLASTPFAERSRRAEMLVIGPRPFQDEQRASRNCILDYSAGRAGGKGVQPISRGLSGQSAYVLVTAVQKRNGSCQGRGSDRVVGSYKWDRWRMVGNSKPTCN